MSDQNSNAVGTGPVAPTGGGGGGPSSPRLEPFQVGSPEHLQKLTAITQGTFSDQESRRAALNLMEDAVAARLAGERENLERQRAEETLRQRERELARVQRIGGVGGFEFDVAEWSRRLSPEYIRLHGLPPDTTTETPDEWLGRLYPDDRERAERTLREALLDRNGAYECEYRIVRPSDGQVRWILAKADIERDHEGRAIRLVGAHIDVTVQKRLEATLAFLGELSQNLISLSTAADVARECGSRIGEFLGVKSCAFVEIDARLDQATVVEEWHQSSVPSLKGRFKISDYLESEFQALMAAKQPAVIHDVNHDPRVHDPARFAALGIGAFLNVPLVRAGEWVFVLGVYHNEPRQWSDYEVGLIVDIANRIWNKLERVRAETRLRELNASLDERVREQTQKLREGQERLRALALELSRAEQQERKRLAGVLHDEVQQYLVAAKLRAGIAMQESAEPQRRKQIEASIDMLDEAIHATRAMARELSPPVLHEQGLGPGLQWLANRFHKQYGVHIEVSADDELDLASESQRDLLFQVARELLLNVVKHSGARQAWIILAQLPREIEMVVRDEGVGFNPERLNGTIESFGLFHIRERLAPLGGRLEIESQTGEGTLARVILPTEPGAAESTTSAGTRPAALSLETPRRVTVVVVDDHQIIREGIRSLLVQEDNIEVVGEAGNGETALQLARALRPDVIIMDINMPGMNGIQATRYIHSELPGIRIVGLSLHDEQEMSTAMLSAGAVGYVAKDGPSNSLIEAIRGTNA